MDWIMEAFQKDDERVQCGSCLRAAGRPPRLSVFLHMQDGSYVLCAMPRLQMPTYPACCNLIIGLFIGYCAVLGGCRFAGSVIVATPVSPFRLHGVCDCDGLLVLAKSCMTCDILPQPTRQSEVKTSECAHRGRHGETIVSLA
jgi:hypothetical protein